MNKGKVLTKEEINCVKQWLELDREKAEGDCPFTECSASGVHSICISWFKAVELNKEYPQSVVKCPCAIYSYHYVRRRAAEAINYSIKKKGEPK